MLWLIWQMWFFLILAFLIGLGLGWRLWSASGESGRALQAAKDEIGRLQRENDSLSSVAARHQAALEVSRITVKPEASASKSKTAKSPAKSDAVPDKAPTVKTEVNELTAIKGLGPKAAAALNADGITSFSQIARWTPADITRWDEKLTARGRIEREDWVGQAKSKLG
ncbi:MAG: hypothetical protein COW29_11490 [Rhodobacterales bacterium CG15_BIG_FIL_POST_REV_8_21_14_020_59_13]|nr:MAG: hypothetical protein COW29_11490 [Rhodobacterales bacterium CG15_BIG_FIL_POST_REV_8_21_14_020_59_13]